MKRIVMGVLAHVDSGKTTLSEALLYLCKSIKKLGRVDHKDTALDTNRIEKDRGITVFSKQAVLGRENMQICLLDTPGHVDFSREAERTLGVLDCAVLVISATAGVQSHTVTLWNLLKSYNVPTFIFVNKTDLPTAEIVKTAEQISQKLSPFCIDFTQDKNRLWEEAALGDEAVMEKYMTEGLLSPGDISNLIFSRKIFPVFYGSALKLEGVEELLQGVETYTPDFDCPDKLGARVFKISRDGADRLTFVKITGGSLSVRDTVEYTDEKGEKHKEKITGIRQYTGDKYRSEQTAYPGGIYAFTGLTRTGAGTVMGFEKSGEKGRMQAVFSYRVIHDDTVEDAVLLQKLRVLEEEEPSLCVEWLAEKQQINIRLMGQIQLEVIKAVVFQRFGIDIDFDKGSVVYKETISDTVEGVGHFEPLRHYAEVHLLLEPLKRGEGLVFDSRCSEDMLERNWQRLILTHMGEKTHIGTLTGSPITDMKITLVSGRAHTKHTEGGDFRQATYRRVRNGLMQAKSVLLEPWYDFEIYLPSENVGRVMADIQRMSGEFETPVTRGLESVVKGYAPAGEIHDYSRQLANFTKGQGRLSLSFREYAPCHNRRQVIEQIGYSREADSENTADSVFCTHGAGYIVKWDKVREKMHLPPYLKKEKPRDKPQRYTPKQVERYYAGLEEDKELLKIFEQTYGKIRTDKYLALKSAPKEEPGENVQTVSSFDKEYLLVDGYNIIFAWEELKKMAESDPRHARSHLADILCNYRGFKKCEVILVFDAYKVKGNTGYISKYHNITIVYTKEAETADMYIEKVTHQMKGRYKVSVATSDGLEQIIILGHGAMRISASALKEEVDMVQRAIREYLQ